MSVPAGGASLHRKLPFIVALTTVATVAAFGLFAYRTVRSSAIEATETRLRSAVGEIGGIMALGAVNILNTLDQVARHPAVVAALSRPAAPLSDSVTRVLRTLEGRPGTVVAVELRDSRGVVRLSTAPRRGAAGLAVTPNDSGPRIGPIFRRDSLVLFESFAPVMASGRLLGEVRVTRRTGPGANQRVVSTLLGREAVLLMGNGDGSLWLDSRRAVSRPSVSSGPIHYQRDGQTWISAAVRLMNMPWAFAAELPESSASAAARSVVAPLVGVGILVAFVGALLGAWVSRTVTRPLVQLTTATEAIAQGDLAAHPLPSERRDEIGRLARAFTAMAESIRGSRDHLEGEISIRTGELKAALGQLRDAQEDLLKKERLAAIGQISASIGHELRNPLSVMSNASYLIEAQPDASLKLREYVALLREQIRISQRIISDLLSTVQSSAPVRAPVNVAALLELHLAQVTIPPTIRVERHIPADLPLLVVDPDQVGRILVNVVANAVQAMEGGEGSLTLAAGTRDGCFMIEITDTGPGIPAAAADRIFEPLYTTKPRGIGLGLSVSREMARANGGDLRVDLRNGRGACFVLELPIVEGGETVISTADVPSASHAKPPLTPRPAGEQPSYASTGQ